MVGSWHILRAGTLPGYFATRGILIPPSYRGFFPARKDSMDVTFILPPLKDGLILRQDKPAKSDSSFPLIY